MSTNHKFGTMLLIVITSVMTMFGCAEKVTVEQPDDPPPTIVFVHGAWGGGWQFHKVQPLLEARGFRVYRPTMTGLGERVHLAGPDVGLATHIDDIVNLIEFENLHRIILVGHSYGGMVVAGVADRIPQRIARLVFMDAILPENGESVESLFGDAIQHMATAGGDGAEPWLLVPRWVEQGQPPPVDVPQPIRTFTDTINLENPATESIQATYILTIEAGKETDDFDVFAQRARDRGWDVVTMTAGHNPQWFQPEVFVGVLVTALQE